MIALLLACAPDPLAEWGQAYCDYLDRCCEVENTFFSSCSLRAETCAVDWSEFYADCDVPDADRLDACIACYEALPLEDVETYHVECNSNAAARCGDACDNTITCPETAL